MASLPKHTHRRTRLGLAGGASTRLTKARRAFTSNDRLTNVKPNRSHSGASTQQMRQTASLKQMSIERHKFAHIRRRIKPRNSYDSTLSTQALRASEEINTFEGEAPPNTTMHSLSQTSQQCRDGSGSFTTAQCDSVLTRGKPTHRVTILLNRRVATQRASPVGRRWVLFSRGYLSQSDTHRESPRILGMRNANPEIAASRQRRVRCLCAKRKEREHRRRPCLARRHHPPHLP